MALLLPLSVGWVARIYGGQASFVELPLTITPPSSVVLCELLAIYLISS
jgi:hypothetical protein